MFGPLSMHLRFPSLLGLVFFTASLSAQSSVWKITRGDSVLYLGGTCHVLRQSDFPLPAEFDAAFAASTKLVFETDVARVQSPEMQQIVATEGFAGDDRTLDRVLSPATWKAVQRYCASAGLPESQARRMKPWLFTVMIATLELQKLGVSLEGVDFHFFQRATAAKKKTGELEPFDRHVRFITRLGAGHEDEMVAQSLDEIGEIPTVIDKLLAAWKVGDLAHLDEFMLREMREKYPTIFQELLVDRNRAWLPEIDTLLKTPEVEFVLVGVGHLPGTEGLLAQLKARGCTVEQVRATAAKK